MKCKNGCNQEGTKETGFCPCCEDIAQQLKNQNEGYEY